MRYFLTIYILVIVAVVSIAGFRGETFRKPPIEIFPDMDRQPKLHPQSYNEFFEDGLASRKPVQGAVSRGAAFASNEINTGKSGEAFVDALPVDVNRVMLNKGRERYNINCAPCHGAVGDGKGITTQYGMVAVANFHDKRLLDMPDGQIFHTIGYGKGLMLGYASQISVEDRWAIVAYIRALQISRLGFPEDLTEKELKGMPSLKPQLVAGGAGSTEANSQPDPFADDATEEADPFGSGGADDFGSFEDF